VHKPLSIEAKGLKLQAKESRQPQRFSEHEQYSQLPSFIVASGAKLQANASVQPQLVVHEQYSQELLFTTANGSKLQAVGSVQPIGSEFHENVNPEGGKEAGAALVKAHVALAAVPANEFSQAVPVGTDLLLT
jgi:hypothetical protein